jgi:hypothetical protein
MNGASEQVEQTNINWLLRIQAHGLARTECGELNASCGGKRTVKTSINWL